LPHNFTKVNFLESSSERSTIRPVARKNFQKENIGKNKKRRLIWKRNKERKRDWGKFCFKIIEAIRKLKVVNIKDHSKERRL
jgi:hypothetical protein